MADIEKFQKQVHVTFVDKRLLEAAFTHRSYLNENKTSGREHNERLEFLGDAVLELVVTEFLFKKYPRKAEGELTSVRAALVNTNSISACATELGMNEHLLLSKGEAADVGRARQYILANVFEAFVGALYLDQGYNVARDFISTHLLHKTEAIVAGSLWQDAKSLFQEKAQEHAGVTPTYKTIREVGPDHAKRFTVGVYISKELIFKGEGLSKQEAETAAARGALKKQGWG